MDRLWWRLSQAPSAQLARGRLMPTILRLRELIGPKHLKAVARPTVPMRRAHASNRMKKLTSDAQRLRIDQCVLDLDSLHQTDDQPIVSDLQSPPLLAFQTGGRFRNSWRTHDGGRARTQPRHLE